MVIQCHCCTVSFFDAINQSINQSINRDVNTLFGYRLRAKDTLYIMHMANQEILKHVADFYRTCAPMSDNIVIGQQILQKNISKFRKSAFYIIKLGSGRVIFTILNLTRLKAFHTIITSFIVGWFCG